MTQDAQKYIAAALTTLIALQSLMLMALFAGVPPHPPAAVAPFGIGPFIVFWRAFPIIADRKSRSIDSTIQAVVDHRFAFFGAITPGLSALSRWNLGHGDTFGYGTNDLA